MRHPRRSSRGRDQRGRRGAAAAAAAVRAPVGTVARGRTQLRSLRQARSPRAAAGAAAERRDAARMRKDAGMHEHARTPGSRSRERGHLRLAKKARARARRLAACCRRGALEHGRRGVREQGCIGSVLLPRSPGLARTRPPGRAPALERRRARAPGAWRGVRIRRAVLADKNIWVLFVWLFASRGEDKLLSFVWTEKKLRKGKKDQRHSSHLIHLVYNMKLFCQTK